MKKTLIGLAVVLCSLFPAVSFADSGLTYSQASSIIVLLEAFGVDQSTVNVVWGIIQPVDTPVTPPTVATIQNTEQVETAPVFGGTNSTQDLPSTITIPVLPIITASIGQLSQDTLNKGTHQILGSFSLASSPEGSLSSIEVCTDTNTGNGVPDGVIYLNGMSQGSAKIISECTSGVTVFDFPSYDIGAAIVPMQIYGDVDDSLSAISITLRGVTISDMSNATSTTQLMDLGGRQLTL